MNQKTNNKSFIFTAKLSDFPFKTSPQNGRALNQNQAKKLTKRTNRNVLMGFLTLILTPFLVYLPLQNFSKPDFNETLTTASLSTVPNQNAHKGTISDENEEKDVIQYRIKKVVIDAGHGGHDSGCHHHAGVEKKNTLAIALKLGERLKEEYPEIEIIYTRTTDVFVELHERAEIANRAKADLFISIHCNSSDEGAPQGTETYVLGMHKMEENLNVAKRENASILLEEDYEKEYEGFDPNSNEAYIIFSLYQNAYLDKSILFARYVEESFKTNASRRSLGVKQAGFVVLRRTAMPSVLVETGFLNNPTEGAFLSSTEGQGTIAESVLLAFKRYKKSVETRPEEPKVRFVNTEGVVYKIQLATSSQDFRNETQWKAIPRLEVVKDGDLYRYFQGGIADYNTALSELNVLRSQGYEDAFIVAYKNGKRMILDKGK